MSNIYPVSINLTIPSCFLVQDYLSIRTFIRSWFDPASQECEFQKGKEGPKTLLENKWCGFNEVTLVAGAAGAIDAGFKDVFCIVVFICEIVGKLNGTRRHNQFQSMIRLRRSGRRCGLWRRCTTSTLEYSFGSAFVMVQALYVGFKDGFDALSFIGERVGKLNGTRHNQFQSMVRWCGGRWCGIWRRSTTSTLEYLSVCREIMTSRVMVD